MTRKRRWTRKSQARLDTLIVKEALHALTEPELVELGALLRKRNLAGLSDAEITRMRQSQAIVANLLKTFQVRRVKFKGHIV